MVYPDPGRSLLFGALALRSSRLDEARLARACARWAERGTRASSLADVLESSGCLDRAARDAVDRLVEWQLRESGGDARAALAAIADEPFKRCVSSIGDAAIRSLLGDDAAGPPAANRYEPTRLHAKGGLGQVWLARDVDLEREVALKEILPECAKSAALRRRFIAEARITGRLDHPGVVPIYELVRQPSGAPPFYAMRFVRGRTLSEASRAYHARGASGGTGALEMQALLQAFIGVCNTIAFAHSKKVIHRDLKGENVILGDYGEVIVLDWGLAKDLAAERGEEGDPVAAAFSNRPELTMDGDVVGTPAYMSPEQAEGRIDDVDERSDVYGLGAILYEILTGRPPFDGRDTVEVLRLVREGRPPRPRSLAPRTPRALEAICLEALYKRKEDRYAAASDLADDVRRFLADEPVDAYREPLWQRAGRFSRRHRALVAGAGVLLVTAVIALSVGLELLSAKQREVALARERAERNFGLARGAVDKYFDRVAWNRELLATGLEPLRRQLLGTAKEFYETFLLERSGDPALARDLASALLNLGLIEKQTGELDDAEAHLVRSVAGYEALLGPESPPPGEFADFLNACNHLALLYHETSRPDRAEAAFTRALDAARGAGDVVANDPLCQSKRAGLEDDFGTMLVRNGRGAEGERAHGEAIVIRRRLVAAEPGNSDHRNALVKSLNNLGARFANTGRAAEAEPLLREAAEIVEGFVRENPGVPEHLNDLGATYNNLGGICTLVGRSDDAREAHEKALAIREKLVRQHPVVLEYGISLAGSYCNLGEIACREGDPRKGLEWLTKAVDVLGGVLAREPRQATALYYTSYAESWRARALDALGRDAEALERWDRATLLDTRNDPALRIGRAATLARLGRLDEARSLANAAAALEIASPEDRYALAIAFARAGDAERAVAALRQAAEAGYFADPSVVERAAGDPDWAGTEAAGAIFHSLRSPR